jgi:hypothetical protein
VTTDSTKVFATFVKGEPDSVMKFNDAGITLNIKTIDIKCTEKDSHGATTTDSHGAAATDSHGAAASGHDAFPVWDYSQNGADWPDKYPNCADGVQSPINLIDPVTSYGLSYYQYNYAEDEYTPEYWDLE